MPAPGSDASTIPPDCAAYFSAKCQQKEKEPKSSDVGLAPALAHLTAGRASPGSSPSRFPGLRHFLTRIFFLDS